jgi:O-acetyl-ADP-ribose deacetylase (regulator of RNase III)
VAFPSISTGVYRFPVGRAAGIAITAMREGLRDHGEIEKILMVCFDEKTKAAYEEALHGQKYI